MSGQNRLSIHTTCRSINKIFNCPQRDFLKEVSEYYKLPEQEIQLWDNAQQQIISVYDLKDMMKIDIMEKDENPQLVTNRRLRSNLAQSSKVLTVVETITKKLRENSTLNGSERKFLIEHLEKNPLCETLKRKRSGENGVLNTVQTSNKKLQVCMTNSKDSFCQTEDLYKDVHEKPILNTGELIEKMKLMAASGTCPEEEVAELMLETYNARRTFLMMEMPPVAVFKENYPLLFSVCEVKNELERILYKGNCDIFLKNIEKYAESIRRFKSDEDDYIYMHTMKYMDRGKTENQKNYARDVGSILLIPGLLDENFHGFLKLSDNANASKPGKYPYINAETTAMKELFFDQSLFKIIVEGTLLCEASNFKEALLCLMASFFIFNIEYPEACKRTYIVFEKLYLEANDTEEIDTNTDQLIKYFKQTIHANKEILSKYSSKDV